MNVLPDFLAATVRTATPLALAALGETVGESAGVINVGLEGIIITGAFAGLVGSITVGVYTGFIASALAGMAVAALFALFAVVLRADQIITGTAVTLFGLGLTGTLYRRAFGATGAALRASTQHATGIPVLDKIPIIGTALFAQPAITYLVYLIVPALWWALYRTRLGLALRAVGENPEAARAAGIDPRKVQFGAVLFGGIMGGLAGGTLVLSQVGTFAEGMSAGRGFIAIAVVALGRWHPLGAAIGALLFGAASALQFLFQAMGWAAPYQLFLGLPYLLTLVALAALGRSHPAPAALGK
ncbi:MAG TPA: ABC transporter permease [Gemmatimonadaceae bacterium]|nr:ABC transporter permease [Gemmatimonadaceae bacterium]